MARPNMNSDRIQVTGTGNAIAADAAARHGMRRESRLVMLLGIVFVLVLLAAFVLPTNMFTTNVYTNGFRLSQFLETIAVQLNLFIGMFTGDPLPYETRFMGVVVCAASGCALGLCGSTYQGAFNNPLAAPKTLGVMAGGALGSLVYVMTPLATYFMASIPNYDSLNSAQQAEVDQWLFYNDFLGWIMSHYGECLFSVCGCFIVVGIVMLITQLAGRGRMSNIIVIVCGQVISTAVTAVITFLRYSFTVEGGIDMADTLKEIENYSMNESFSYPDLLLVVLPLVVCMVVILLMRNRFTMLSFGDDEAQTMGVNVNRTRIVMIVICTFMVGWAISFCGHIAFLGFISAHLARKVVGPDFRWLLPASIFTGGTLITVIYWLAQSGLPFTSPYACGTICSILGGCVFLLFAVREGRRAYRESRF